MMRGATVTRTRFGYSVRYWNGIGISEKTHSWRLTRGWAERVARRFVKGPRVDGEVVARFGQDDQANNGFSLAP